MTSHLANAERDPRGLAGQVALVTGAGRGMGRSVARALAGAGAAVAVNDLDPSRADAVTQELSALGAEAIAVPGDVTSVGDVVSMVSQTVERFARLSILINNAGILRSTRLLDISETEWDAVMDVSVKGTFLVTRAALPHLIRNGWGRVINVSSTAGKSVSTLGGAHYTTAKAAVLGFSRAVAKEMARFGITSNAICPGLIDTEMVHEHCSPDERASYEASFPIARLGRPGEVAGLVLFLCSRHADYITGASLDINGGDLMV